MADVALTNAPRRKVLAATGGAALGTALSVVFVYIIQSVLNIWSITLPKEVEEALGTIITSLITLSAGWYVAPGADEVVVKDGVGVKSGLTTL